MANKNLFDFIEETIVDQTEIKKNNNEEKVASRRKIISPEKENIPSEITESKKINDVIYQGVSEGDGIKHTEVLEKNNPIITEIASSNENEEIITIQNKDIEKPINKEDVNISFREIKESEIIVPAKEYEYITKSVSYDDLLKNKNKYSQSEEKKIKIIYPNIFIIFITLFVLIYSFLF